MIFIIIPNCEDVELYMLSCVPVCQAASIFLASSTSSACQQTLAGRAAKRDEWSGVHCRQGKYD